MGTFNYGVGKGLREPCSPYRQANLFGATLGDFDANGWNCLPQILSPTTTFDLSTITLNHEVVVALLRVDNTSAGGYDINFRWYKERDNALLFDYTFSVDVGAGRGLYAYSYIGWVDWEINENGSYRVEITVTGVDPFHAVKWFTISGIPEEPVPEPLPIRFMDGILAMVGNVATFFYEAYQTVRGWVWPFYLLQYPLYSLYSTSQFLLTPITTLGEWVSGVAIKILSILSTWDISEFFRDIFEAAVNAWNWVRLAWTYVWQIVNAWWGTITDTVLGWINVAKQVALDLIAGVQVGLNLVMTAWANFWRTTLPTLATIFTVENLIDSTLRSWFPFYNELVMLWGVISEFFTNPLDWIANLIESWFWES